MAKSAVGFRDGCKPTLDRGDGMGFGQIGQILREGVWRTGDVPAGCPEVG